MSAKPIGSHGKYEQITFSVPASVASTARKGLSLRQRFGNDAYRKRTEVGAARARQLSSGSPRVTLRDIVYMNSYFSRHAVDLKGPMDPARPSNGWMSWLLWGGSPGQKWARSIYNRYVARKNPSPATTLAALRYRRRPGVLRDLRLEAPSKQTIDDALQMIYDFTGERQERVSALLILRQYLISRFWKEEGYYLPNGYTFPAEDVLHFLMKEDPLLAKWCAAQMVKYTVSYVPKQPADSPSLRGVTLVKEAVKVIERSVYANEPTQLTLRIESELRESLWYIQEQMQFELVDMQSSENIDPYSVNSWSSAVTAVWAAIGLLTFSMDFEDYKRGSTMTAAARDSLAYSEIVRENDAYYDMNEIRERYEKIIFSVVVDAVLTYPEAIRKNPRRVSKRRRASFS